MAQKTYEIVAKDMQVSIKNYDRGTAEQKYGFRIYQGGVVPVKSVRIVSIEDFDIEAWVFTSKSGDEKSKGKMQLLKKRLSSCNKIDDKLFADFADGNNNFALIVVDTDYSYYNYKN